MELIKYTCSCCGKNISFDGTEKTVTCESCGTTYAVSNELEKNIDPNKKEADELLKIFATRDMLLKKQNEVYDAHDNLNFSTGDILSNLKLSTKEVYNYGYYSVWEDYHQHNKVTRIDYKRSYATILPPEKFYKPDELDYLCKINLTSESFANGGNPYQDYVNEWAKENDYDMLKSQSDELGQEKDKIGKVMDRSLIKLGKKYTELDHEYGKLANAQEKIDYILNNIDNVKKIADFYESLTNEQKEDVYNYFKISEQLIAVNNVISDLSEIAKENLAITNSNNIYDLNFDIMADASKIKKYHELKENVYQMFESYGLTSKDQNKDIQVDRQIA